MKQYEDELFLEDMDEPFVVADLGEPFNIDESDFSISSGGFSVTDSVGTLRTVDFH